MREQVQKLLAEAVARVVQEVDSGQAEHLPSVSVVPARQAGHGDFASSVAMGLARSLELAPREIAVRIRSAIRDPDGLIERTEIAGPGFLNFFLARSRWHALLSRILSEREAYGRCASATNERIQVEFVSVNPTGPLTIGHGRNAVLGDTIARLLAAAGHTVTREYYFNNAGRQMRLLADSLRARYEQLLGRPAELPEDGYRGEYLTDVARELVRRHADGWLEKGDDAFREVAEEAIFAQIRSTLERLGIHFDVYTNESSLFSEGLVESTLADLRDAGLVYESEGAVWLRSTDFGLERDRVLIKSGGEPTYLLPDVAYHCQKFRRGFTRIIDVLGPDHIEQFPYVRAATGALGFNVDVLEIAVYQWVNLRRGDELIKMSTRSSYHS